MISAVDEDLARARAADISSAAAHRGHALNAHNFITADDSDSERSSFDSSSNGDEGSRRSLPLAAAGRTISLRQLNNDRGEGGADNGLGTSQRFTTRESDGSFEALNQWLPKNITANAEKRGVVHKQCSKLSFLWQKRFFVLTNEGVLYYYAKVAHRCTTTYFILCFHHN